MTYDWDKHWERVSAAYVAEFGIPWLNIPPPPGKEKEPRMSEPMPRNPAAEVAPKNRHYKNGWNDCTDALERILHATDLKKERRAVRIFAGDVISAIRRLKR